MANEAQLSPRRCICKYMKLAFKYRFYPTKEQANLLARTFGCVRYVYNWGLALRRNAWTERKESISFLETGRRLTQLKQQEETRWLRDVSCVPLRETLHHLDTAYQNFFQGRSSYPQFKLRHSKQSAYFTRRGFSYRVEDGQPVLKLAKMSAPLKVRWSRTPPSGPSGVTVSRDPAGRYFVCLLCEVAPEPLPVVDNAIGVDLGLIDLVSTSGGFKSGNPRFLKRDLAKLRWAQKSLSRKRKGSNNWYRQKRRVAKIYARIKDCRSDYLHQMSIRLIRENQTIVLETLNVAGMIKNRSLARSISDASWSEFVRQLEYKAVLYGREVVRVGQWEPTSKRCSSCGVVVSELPLSIRSWTCASCGAEHDRDVNAARNILGAGLALSACGPSVRPVPLLNGKAVRDEARIPQL